MQLARGAPLRLPDRLLRAAGHPAVVQPELATVPGHVRVVPAEPAQGPVARAHARGRVEVAARGEHLRLAAGRGHPHHLVHRLARAAVGLAHAHDVAAGRGAAVGVANGPSGVIGTGSAPGSRRYRRWSSELERTRSVRWSSQAPPPYSCTLVRTSNGGRRHVLARRARAWCGPRPAGAARATRRRRPRPGRARTAGHRPAPPGRRRSGRARSRRESGVTGGIFAQPPSVGLPVPIPAGAPGTLQRPWTPSSSPPTSAAATGRATPPSTPWPA